jgi:hypothetical protein
MIDKKNKKKVTDKDDNGDLTELESEIDSLESSMSDLLSRSEKLKEDVTELDDELSVMVEDWLPETD